MAYEDPIGIIIDDCRYSSSQDDLLRHSKFAREDEFSTGDDGRKSHTPEDLAAGKELDVADNTGGTNRGKIAVVGVDTTNLGFPGNREGSTIEVVNDGKVRISEVLEVRDREIFLKPSSIEPPLKKSRVSSLKSPDVIGERDDSPLVHCTEKVVIEIEENSKQVVVLKSGVKVEIVSPLRCVAPDSVQTVEKLGLNDDDNNQDNKINGENPAKKKLEFGGDNTEEIEIEIENIKRQEKRELPRSIIGQVWGVTQDENGVFGNGNEEVGLNPKSVGRSHENGKSKGCEAMRCLLDVLRMLAGDSYENDSEIDIFETAKKRGMTFPQCRFLLEMEEKE